jgi:hypothetical protein
MGDLSMLQTNNVELFRHLVLQPGTLTLTAIRAEMSPVLEGIDDIVLIREMIEIRRRDLDGDFLAVA